MAREKKKSALREKLSAIRWGLKIAWGIDHKVLLIWGGLSVVLSVLPAIALIYNKQSLAVISGFLSGQAYSYGDAVSSIVKLGILLTLIGLSGRVNRDLIYMMMFDSYYFGMEEQLTDAIHRIKLQDLLKRDVIDEYNYCVYRVGALTDLTSSLCDIAGKLVSAVSLLIAAYSSSKLVLLISIAYIAGVFILNYKVSAKIRFDVVQSRTEESMAGYYENLASNPGAAKETRIFGNVDHLIDQWRSHISILQNTEIRRQRSRSVSGFISGVGFYVFLIVMIATSIFSLVRGTMSPDVLLVIFTLCLNIYNMVTGLPDTIEKLDFVTYVLERERVFFTLGEEPDPAVEERKADTPLDTDTVFRAEHLIFRYNDGTPAVNDVSFEIKKGEIVALVGQNGSGKTTLIKLLADMYRPSSGRLEFFGRPVEEYKNRFIRSKIGVFFQDFWLFHLTLRDNVGMGNISEINNDEKVLRAIRKGGAYKLLAGLPKGLDTMVNKNVDKTGVIFSGGERQRIGVSRTHMSDKEVLIFDEPASMLDPIAEMEQFMELRELMEGRTAVMISHRVGFARLASKIILMDNGKIAEVGTHEELMAQNGLYANMFNQQAKWYIVEPGSQEVMAQ